MQPNPFATIASPTGNLQDRLARVNRGNSGITAIQQANGTPLLTNRPEVVDTLSDAEVGGVVEGGTGGDPRALLRMLIEGNDTRGRGHSAELAAQPALQEEAVRQRVAGLQGGFKRDQYLLDENAKADAFFLPQVQRKQRYENADALEQLQMKALPAQVAAQADIYGHDLEAESDRYTADQGFAGNAIRALGSAYGDAESAGAMPGKSSQGARDGAAILRTLLQRLVEGGGNAPVQ